MAKSNFNPALYGLDDLKEELSGKKLDKAIKRGLGEAALKLHQAISFEILRNYHVEPNALDKVWINKGKARNPTTLGKDVLSVSLEYRYKAKDLSKFPYSWKWDNINPEAKRKGRVHSVSINRTNGAKIVYGKNHFGGFVPKGFRNEYGAQMFERDEPGRDSPLHVLFGPSLTDMAAHVFETRVGGIADAIANIEDTIIEIYAGL